MLTRQQLNLLIFINEIIRETGCAPSFTEMCTVLGLKSKSCIHRLLTALEERGFVRRLHNRVRAIEVIRMPDNDTRAPAKLVLMPTQALPPPIPEGFYKIPVMGRIGVGVPVSSIRQRTREISAPAHLVDCGGEHFALDVRGDSMREAGIFDGDVAIFRRRTIAITGDIVLAVIDGEEATLKRFRGHGGAIALEAANAAYETRIFARERVNVHGRLTGILRKY